MASQMKFIVALAIVAALLCTVQAQDYDDEGGNNQGNDGYGGFGSGGDDDYAAPRERGIVGAEGSDISPGYQPQGDDAGADSYDSDDSAAAASNSRPTIARPNLIKLIKASRR